jgi:type II secretion system protein N
VKERYLNYLKYVGRVGYPLFYVFALLVFASLTFPYRRLKEHIVGQFNANQRDTNGTQELQIDDMGGYWLTGVRMSGLTLLSAPTEPGKPPSHIDIEDATARLAVLPMLIGDSVLHFGAHAFGGEASGYFDESGKDRAVDVDLDSIDVGKLQPLADALGVPLGGTLSGGVHLTMPDGKAAKASGSIALDFKNLWIGDGKAKIKGALALPRIDVGALTIAGEAKEGVLKISKMAAGGKDLDVQGDGRILLRELATDSLLEMQLRFKINDVYKGKNEVTQSLFGAPGSSSSGLFELADPKIKQSKRPDGFYAWMLRGPLGKPDFNPAPMALAPATGH